MSKRKQGRQPPKPPETALPQPDSRATALLFSPAILTGALLLFAVQPLIARYLLPWFGGGPGVWTTCMLFFQALLLGGYLYAHVSVKYLPTRGQIVVHLVLLAGSLALIPIIPSERWKPADASDPVWRILLLLGAAIGLPYFVLSATSPLLQAWFVKAKPGVSPYRLFALSNLGSLIALIAYPTILEPLFTRRQQAWIWSTGLILFALTCAACAIHVWRARQTADATTPSAEADSRAQEPEGRIFLWLALSMVGSVLLLAITNTLTEDVAVTPFLWVIPLALYLLTFVIAFDGPRWYPRRVVFALLPLCALWLVRIAWVTSETLLEQFVGNLVALFVACLFCHGELARLKPAPRHLTAYYLAISVGGALGGVFVALLAPRIFDRLLELPIGMLAAGFLSFACIRLAPFRHGDKLAAASIVIGFMLLLGVPVFQPLFREGGRETVIDRSRNFYGTLLTVEVVPDGPADAFRLLNHGTTSHGGQFLAPEKRISPMLYYREGSGVSAVFRHRLGRDYLKVGLVGEGAGSLAAYGKGGDVFRFYEINPDVDAMARKWFTYLADTPATTEVVFGDARLMLEREDDQNFDVLVLDAFSGDAVPTHLLTAEAFDEYLRHLAPDGVIAVHFSNRSVDLSGVLLRQASRLKLPTAVGDINFGWWMLMSRKASIFSEPSMLRYGVRQVMPNERSDLWTDDYVNLLRIVRWMPDSPRT
jgi:hypothetical protein